MTANQNNTKKNKNTWFRAAALTLAMTMAVSTTATAFAAENEPASEITLPAFSLESVEDSMLVAEKALREMKAGETSSSSKNENTASGSQASSSSSSSTASAGSSSKGTQSSGKQNGANSQSAQNNTKTESSEKPASSASSSASNTTQKNAGCEIDTSKASSGTIRVRQNGNPTKVKVLVYFNGGSKYYQYTIPTNNTWTSIPLQSGSGTYKVRFMKQVNGNSYSQMYSISFQVSMNSANSAYLNPSQYVVYNSGSACVAKAKSLAGSGSDAQKVSKIYSYIVNNISYDYAKMENLPSGYLPNPDSTLASRKGICFDYAALMAAMLRSQGVPCKLVIGHADGAYHAWNMVYVNGGWQLYDPTYGAAGQRASSYKAERVY